MSFLNKADLQSSNLMETSVESPKDTILERADFTLQLINVCNLGKGEKNIFNFLEGSSFQCSLFREPDRPFHNFSLILRFKPVKRPVGK